MKKRLGFVSNSSSCSFIIAFPSELDMSSNKEITKFLFGNEELIADPGNKGLFAKPSYLTEQLFEKSEPVSISKYWDGKLDDFGWGHIDGKEIAEWMMGFKNYTFREVNIDSYEGVDAILRSWPFKKGVQTLNIGDH